MYKPEVLWMTIEYGRSQSTSPIRFIRGVGEDGLFMSGFIADQRGLRQVMAGRYDLPIKAIRITTASPGQYQQEITVAYHVRNVEGPPR
jgi:hypothetical protein